MKTKKRELITVALVIGVIVVIAIAYMIYTNKIIGNKNVVNGGIPNALDETTENLYAADTSNWDESKVTIVYDTEGVPVPVPKGFSASQVDGEHTVKTGFVIYEGEEPVTGTNSYEYGTDAYNASRTRNQWVWVPCSSSDNIYEYDGESSRRKTKTMDIYVDAKFNSDMRGDNFLYPYSWVSLFDNFVRIGNINRQDLNYEIDAKNDRDVICKNIDVYNGFYISRYECRPKDDSFLELSTIRRK